MFLRPYRHTRRKRLTRLLTLTLPILLTTTLLLPLYILYKPPRVLISHLQTRFPDVLWHVPLPPSSPPTIALTLDDSPTEFTHEILDLLRENDCRATFFLIGDHIPGREDVLRRAVNEGHELANHAMYDEVSRERSDEELREQILAVQSLIQRIYASVGRGEVAHGYNNNNNNNVNNNVGNGAAVGGGSAEAGTGTGTEEGGVGRYFRPGSGFFTERMRALVAREGYRLVLGSVYPHDAQVKYPWLNARHVLSMVRPGSIVVVHDRRPWTVPMLRVVLPELRRRGYRVGTVTELIKVKEEYSSSSSSSFT